MEDVLDVYTPVPTTTPRGRRCAWTRPAANCWPRCDAARTDGGGRHKVAREDYEYVTERGGVCDLFYAHRAVGRLGRHVVLGERRTRIDFAHCIKESIAMSTTPKHRRSFW